MVNSSARSVTAVAISGTKVLLTLASQVVYGDVVTVAYTKPSTNPLQTAAGGQAASITAQSVINNCSLAVNQPPVITITSPTKSITFVAPATITIEATAFDPDGSVSKVEIYNGSTKLGETSSSPYTYTWKDVADGFYTLTAVAIDNMNAKTVSEAINVVVEKSASYINQHPVVQITSPDNRKKYKKHDSIVLKAAASDPDGTITKVEFMSGDVVLAEFTSEPYTYIMQDVDTGKYMITAIATDNLGATSSSSGVELIIIPDGNVEINLYPNPNDGHFAIDVASYTTETVTTLCIVNSNGKTIYNGLLNEEEYTKQFDLSDLAPGIYILTMKTGGKIIATKKYIKR